MVQVLAISLGVALIAIVFLARRLSTIRRRYAAIVDIDEEVTTLRAAAARNIQSMQRAAATEAAALRRTARLEAEQIRGRARTSPIS